MSTIDDVYIRLTELYVLDRKPEKLRSDLQKLVEAGKSKEEAILTLAVKKGLRYHACIREVKELVKRGKSNEEAISEVAKTMKINPATEEKVKDIEKETLRKELPEPQIPPSLIQRMHFGGLLRCFIHGVAFSLLFVVLAFAWAFILVFLVAVGYILGLIIGLGILMLIIGVLNSILADVIWDIETIKSFWTLLVHGIVLFLILLIVNGIIVLLPNLVYPGIATWVITFIIAAFVDGYVGKFVAVMFAE